MTLLNKAGLYTILFTLMSICGLQPAKLSANESLTEKPLVIVVASYNNIDWYETNLTSILTQDYSNYRVVYVDDCSPDGTGDAVEQFVKKVGQENRFTLVRNDIRSGSPLANHYKAITGYCKDEEIVLCVDGDDWLAHNQVLKIINQTYSSKDIWLTHGTFSEHRIDFKNSSSASAWSILIPSEIIAQNAFRQYRCATHLKTFYAWLFKRINYEDLLYEGKFYPAAGDQALMFPMIEMASERHAFIPEVLYIYNLLNPIGESRVLTKLQQTCEQHVRQNKPYQRLDYAYPNTSDGIGSDI